MRGRVRAVHQLRYRPADCFGIWPRPEARTQSGTRVQPQNAAPEATDRRSNRRRLRRREKDEPSAAEVPPPAAAPDTPLRSLRDRSLFSTWRARAALTAGGARDARRGRDSLSARRGSGRTGARAAGQNVRTHGPVARLCRRAADRMDRATRGWKMAGDRYRTRAGHIDRLIGVSATCLDAPPGWTAPGDESGRLFVVAARCNGSAQATGRRCSRRDPGGRPYSLVDSGRESRGGNGGREQAPSQLAQGRASRLDALHPVRSRQGTIR